MDSVTTWSSCYGSRDLSNHLDLIFQKVFFYFVQLVEAFHATLEEVVEADLLVVSSFSNYIFDVVNILCAPKLHQMMLNTEL